VAKVTIVVGTRCPECKKEQSVEVSAEGYDAWKKGELIQRAMPELNAATRERLITGLCPECWDAMFADENES
jgi:Zn ribbon nucleic-acid-binding protein